MIKKIGALLVTVLGLLLLIYSATRSLDFISLTLPPDRQILAYFGLAALDGGLIAWLLGYMYGSHGGWQRAISMIMIIVDLIGAVAMFTLDTLYNTGKSGMTTALTPDELQMAVLALSGVIAMNIAATVAHHLTDPDKLREQAEEEAFAKVEEASLRQISANAEQLAAKVAPMLAEDWMQNTEARYLANIGTGRGIPTQRQIVDAQSKDVVAPPSKKPKRYNLGRQLFKRPVKVTNEPTTLESSTVAPGNLVDASKSSDAEQAMLWSAFQESVARAKGVTPDKLYSPFDEIEHALNTDQAPQAESDGHPNGPTGES